MKKDRRQTLIRTIIQENIVETQDQLSQLLEENGIHTTQATISRDIREMNIIKAHTKDGKTHYKIFQQSLFKNSQISEEEKLAETVSEVATELTRVQFINIMITIPGNAHAVGVIIDTIKFPDIISTVCGDNTVLIISKDDETAQRVYDYFQQRMAVY